MGCGLGIAPSLRKKEKRYNQDGKPESSTYIDDHWIIPQNCELFVVSIRRESDIPDSGGCKFEFRNLRSCAKNTAEAKWRPPPERRSVRTS